MKFIALVLTLLSSQLFADGIPVPMEQQTPYNWTCASRNGERASLHLFTGKDRFGNDLDDTLYVSTGGSVGTRIPKAATRALLTQKYASIDGRTFTDPSYHRSLTFDVTGSSLAVKLQDGTWKEVVSNCVAAFRPRN